jgi:hypothetical protein
MAWYGTAEPDAPACQLAAGRLAASFTVGYAASCTGPDGTFRFHARITGHADGRRAGAKRDFTQI